MSFRRMTAALIAAAITALAAPAWGQGYHIGALLPNSGPMTQFGQLFSNGANLAADHINADKLLSKPFSINHEDSQGQPQAAVTAMNKLVRVNQEPMVLTAMSGIVGVGAVNVQVVWEPPWEPIRMSDEARVVLNMW